MSGNYYMWSIGCKENKLDLKGKPHCEFKPKELLVPEICMKCKYKEIGIFLIMKEPESTEIV